MLGTCSTHFINKQDKILKNFNTLLDYMYIWVIANVKLSNIYKTFLSNLHTQSNYLQSLVVIHNVVSVTTYTSILIFTVLKILLNTIYLLYLIGYINKNTFLVWHRNYINSEVSYTLNIFVVSLHVYFCWIRHLINDAKKFMVA